MIVKPIHTKPECTITFSYDEAVMLRQILGPFSLPEMETHIDSGSDLKARAHVPEIYAFSERLYTQLIKSGFEEKK
jgi:hypothetical protein